jgi:hypothetical protein
MRELEEAWDLSMSLENVNLLPTGPPSRCTNCGSDPVLEASVSLKAIEEESNLVKTISFFVVLVLCALLVTLWISRRHQRRVVPVQSYIYLGNTA